MSEDAAVLLADFVSSLDNLPLEIHHLLQEINHKEMRATDLRGKALSKDQSLQKFAKPASQGGQGLLLVNPKEDAHLSKARADYERATQTSKDKLALAERAEKLLSRHLNRLSAQLELLTPNVPPLPILPSFTPVIANNPAPIQYNQVYAATPTSGATSHQILQQQAQLQQQQAYHAAYPAGNYGMGTGSTALQGYPYGNDKMKQGQSPSLPAQHHVSYGYPAAPSGGSRTHRPSRLSNVYPVPGAMMKNGQPLDPQQQQHQMQLHQMQQAQLQQQQQQHYSQQQQQQMRSHHGQQQQHSGGSSHTQKRRRLDEAEIEEEVDAEGEDQTPYCFCQRPSFGEMIGCDAPTCTIEWFHLGCVGLKATPEGSWYCSNCKDLKSRARRK